MKTRIGRILPPKRRAVGTIGGRATRSRDSERGSLTMIFEQVATGGCQSYLVGCADTCAAALIDPEVRQVDRYLALATRNGLRVRFVIDTHTHADHFSAARRIAEKVG